MLLILDPVPALAGDLRALPSPYECHASPPEPAAGATGASP